MHVAFKRGRLAELVRSLTSADEIFPTTLKALSTTGMLVKPSLCINWRASLKGRSPLENVSIFLYHRDNVLRRLNKGLPRGTEPDEEFERSMSCDPIRCLIVTHLWWNIVKSHTGIQTAGIHLLDSDCGRCPDGQIFQQQWIERIDARKAGSIVRHELDQPQLT
jgi:hypothetical protein